MSIIKDPHLAEVLNTAHPDNLAILADHITDKGEGRIALSGDVCKRLTEAAKRKIFSESDRACIAEEVQRYAGNTFMNLFRGGEGVSYRELLTDVASRFSIDVSPNESVSDIEMAIIKKVLIQSVEKMTPEEREELAKQMGTKHSTAAGPIAASALITLIRSTGFAPYKLAAIVANAIAKALLGRGLTFAATGTLMRGISVLSGPVGWAITFLWASVDLASPAYRITVPCVLQIAFMRQAAKVRLCSNCEGELVQDAPFCMHCGTKVPGGTWPQDKAVD